MSEPNSLLIAFRDDAAAYCSFVDDLRAGRASTPYTHLLRLLSNLVSSAAAIPFDFPDNDSDDIQAIDFEQSARISREISEAIASECVALISHHQDDEEAVVRTMMLFDDLADLYNDLRFGLDLYARGRQDDIAGAAWQWRFGYEQHWGAHCFRALTTVHELRYQLYLD